MMKKVKKSKVLTEDEFIQAYKALGSSEEPETDHDQWVRDHLTPAMRIKLSRLKPKKE